MPTTRIHATIITIYSHFWIRDQQTGNERMLMLCYPIDADSTTGWISVTAPLGTRLIGRTASSKIDWVAPDGRRRTLTVESIVSQPERRDDRQA